MHRRTTRTSGLGRRHGCCRGHRPGHRCRELGLIVQENVSFDRYVAKNFGHAPNKGEFLLDPNTGQPVGR